MFIASRPGRGQLLHPGQQSRGSTAGPLVGTRCQGPRPEPGQKIDREPYDLLFGEREAPDGTQLGRSPASSRKAADLYAQLLAAEPHATAERKHR